MYACIYYIALQYAWMYICVYIFICESIYVSICLHLHIYDCLERKLTLHAKANTLLAWKYFTVQWVWRQRVNLGGGGTQSDTEDRICDCVIFFFFFFWGQKLFLSSTCFRQHFSVPLLPGRSVFPQWAPALLSQVVTRRSSNIRAVTGFYSRQPDCFTRWFSVCIMQSFPVSPFRSGLRMLLRFTQFRLLSALTYPCLWISPRVIMINHTQLPSPIIMINRDGCAAVLWLIRLNF